MTEKINNILKQCLYKNSCDVIVRYNEPMSAHTTFKVGGEADCFISFQTNINEQTEENFMSFCVDLLNSVKDADLPVFILGGGANIVVSDKGIRGIVLDMTSWKGISALCEEKKEITFKSGTSLDDAASAAGLSGLEFLAGMPGTIGGALYMNARCYGSEIADVVTGAQAAIKSEDGFFLKKMEFLNGEGFGNKKSPFQKIDCLIFSASFKLKKGDKEKMLLEMEKYRNDRKEKGHYLYACAGSVFKNNHNFGKPTGQIIDELGLKGCKIGGAQVADFHGNIIINTGNAKASDIRALVREIEKIVKEKTGFVLEPEILFAGEW